MVTHVEKINIMEGPMWGEGIYTKKEYTRKRSKYRHVEGGIPEKRTHEERIYIK